MRVRMLKLVYDDIEEGMWFVMGHDSLSVQTKAVEMDVLQLYCGIACQGCVWAVSGHVQKPI